MRRNLFLLQELIRRDLTSRFAGSLAGSLWAVFNPLVFCAIYAFVFAVVLRTPSPPGFRGAYVEFLLAGLLPWLGIQEAVARGAAAITDQAHLVKKLSFPVEALVAAAMGTAFLLQAVSVTLLVVFVGVTGHGTIRPGWLLAGFALQAALLTGPVLALAALQVAFRDLGHLISPVLMMLFFLTPILYPEALVPPQYQVLLAFNPLHDLIAAFRAGVLGVPAPPVSKVVLWAALSLVLAFAGAGLFRRMKPAFADLL